jgi:DNA-binding transcriptional LysR family regulator
MLFDQFTTIAQAAALEMGVALLPTFLAEAEIARGRLVVAYGGPVASTGSYYLVWPNDRPMRAPLERFAEWIRSDL